MLSVNFVLIEPSNLWALRYPDQHELHVLNATPVEATAAPSSSATPASRGCEFTPIHWQTGLR